MHRTKLATIHIYLLAFAAIFPLVVCRESKDTERRFNLQNFYHAHNNEINPLSEAKGFNEHFVLLDTRTAEGERTHRDDEKEKKLLMDTAELIFINEINETVGLFVQSSECYKCTFLYYDTATSNSSFRTVMDTTFSIDIVIKRAADNVTICDLSKHFGEYGKYGLRVTGAKNNYVCSVTTLTDPVNSYLPLLWAFLAYVLLAIVWINARFCYLRIIRPRMEANERALIADLGSPSDSSGIYAVSPTPAQQPRTPRLKSLDTFRGICIVVMIFVNNGGGGYADIFEHSTWNGVTVADVVFPCFLWIMGTSMVISQRSLLRRSYTKLRILRKIVKRSMILFLLGLIVNTTPSLGFRYEIESIRIFGVLQRFGVCYLVVGILELIFVKPEDAYQVSFWSPMRDILRNWCQWVVILSLITIHTCITFLLPVPGCPSGYLGPGGISEWGKYSNCTGGATSYVDRVILSSEHMYQHGTAKKMYDTHIPIDPEGILGCLTSILTVYMGVQAGKVLVTYPRWQSRVKRWVVWALANGGLALLLCKASLNDGWIPINKNLWSLSYVFSMSAIAFLLLTLCYLCLDVRHLWNGAPFFYPGMNSILLYVGHEITTDMFPWMWPMKETHSNMLGLNLWTTSLWVLISFWCHHVGFFLKV